MSINPMNRNFYGIGYTGLGLYSPTDEFGNVNLNYNSWRQMFKRCYDKTYLNKHPSYVGCSVSEVWHCFQDYAPWFKDNYYEIPGHIMELDKDILFKGNKIYSPENCVFVPSGINNIFTKRQNYRGKYPIGVTASGNKFIARCNIGKQNGKQKRIYLGTYNTPEEAFVIYKKYKESFIKEIANEYKELIPEKLYVALMRYEVDMND